MKPACDLFCAVVDHWGDAAVCWRLAQRLQQANGWRVRLFIDDLAVLSLLCPQVDAHLPLQTVCGVVIQPWSAAHHTVAADIVIEAFACDLPEPYVLAMTQRPAPVWINLEYLSAESWVDGCHLRTSPHPRLPLCKHFFFPGFSGQTGGLPYGPRPQRRARNGKALRVTLFCYANPALPGLLSCWAKGDMPVHCLVAAGLPTEQVAAWLAIPFAAGMRVRRGALTLRALPFLPQHDYDRLLERADLNFVRGEDSFVRAQWAEKPFVWQAYPQIDDARKHKVVAFLQRYTAPLCEDDANAVHRFWLGWNNLETALSQTHGHEDWLRLHTTLPRLRLHAVRWADSLRNLGELAAHLAIFYRSQRAFQSI